MKEAQFNHEGHEVRQKRKIFKIFFFVNFVVKKLLSFERKSA